MCGCILAVKKQFTYLSRAQPRSSRRTQPNKSRGENKEKAMGRCGARAAGHSRCLQVTGGCCQSCWSHPCLAWAPGGYILQQGQLATALVEHDKHFQPKGRGDACFQKKMLFFKHYPNSAPVWFLLSRQLSSMVSSGPIRNRHIERKYSPDRGTRLFSEKKKKDKRKKETAFWSMLATNSLFSITS